MKTKLFSITLFIILSLPLVASPISTPSTTVVNAEFLFQFKSDFPTATFKEVEFKDGHYKVYFISKNGIPSYALYSRDKELVETYFGISENDLPLISKSHINTKYPAHPIQATYLVTSPNRPARYIVKLKNTEDVMYSGEGYFLRYIKDLI